ncbi:hypothetical protein SAMN05880582_1011739 [Rhizobium sp. RU20A]|uniref:glycosyltransferase family 2 protein n=1 Tax=Rhizobium sp. RU20A TaxID=1907412 RepID=UPI000955363B|nr:glycosyltransferase family 2 protein [Rhizobium sp. RU20A]SIQ40141.1 hypothetical protein SAMN05880582_1011739 [Rhizobium sp. RU20A]
MHPLIRKLVRAPKTAFEQISAAALQRSVAKTDLSKIKARPHRLPGRLIVSLTSYPPRYKHLYYTLMCLLSQTVKADDLILWVSESDEKQLTPEIRSLQAHGLTIGICKDYKSYNKIVHTLEAYPDAFIVTVDDDLYYRPTLLEELLQHYKGDPHTIICHRCHRVKLGPDGTPEPYAAWDYNISASAPNWDVFPTGVGGILYPPGSLPKETLDSQTFTKICASADDVWLYWMALRNGSLFTKVGPPRPVRAWPSSQKIGLHRLNTLGVNQNDTNIARMLEHFGKPF